MMTTSRFGTKSAKLPKQRKRIDKNQFGSDSFLSKPMAQRTSVKQLVTQCVSFPLWDITLPLGDRTAFRFDGCSFNAQPQPPAQWTFQNGASRRLRLGVKRRTQKRYELLAGGSDGHISNLPVILRTVLNNCASG